MVDGSLAKTDSCASLVFFLRSEMTVLHCTAKTDFISLRSFIRYIILLSLLHFYQFHNRLLLYYTIIN